MKYVWQICSIVLLSGPLWVTPAQIEPIKGTLEDLGSIDLQEIRFVDTQHDNVLPQCAIETQPLSHSMPIDRTIPILDCYTELQDARVDRPPLLNSPAPIRSFAALSDSMRMIPPDTMGSVGIFHLMTTLNDRMRIQSRKGVVIQTLSYALFWQTNDAVFDPKIMYDPFEHRWVLVMMANANTAASRVLIAVSRNSDPTGIWDRYAITSDQTEQVWADFPSIGFNGKWIVVQTNMFTVSNNGSIFSRSHLYVLDKARLYNRVMPFEYTLFPLLGVGGTQTPALTYDEAEQNLYLLQNWNGDVDGIGYLRLYAISGNIGSEALNTIGFITITSSWASAHPIIDGGFAPQQDTSRRIMNNDARILSLVVRNGSLWAAHTVFLPSLDPVRAGIQWLQCSPTGLIQQMDRIEDPMATLEVGTYFAFPSIAVNDENDVLIGYSFFNPFFHPSAGYSYRTSTDLPNTMRGNYIIKHGLDIYIKDFGRGRVRWGDYSNTIVDPNGSDFWTIQECSDLRAVNGESRWLTWWGMISPEEPAITLP